MGAKHHDRYTLTDRSHICLVPRHHIFSHIVLADNLQLFSIFMLYVSCILFLDILLCVNWEVDLERHNATGVVLSTENAETTIGVKIG